MATVVGRVPRHAGAGSPIRIAWPWAGRASVRAALRSELHLPRSERVLIRLGRAYGTGVVATDRAMYWQPAGAAWLRLGWEQISRVEEDRAGAGLVVIALAGGTARRTVLPLQGNRLQGNRRLLALAHERIAATRIIVTHLAVDGRELPVEGRRKPAGDAIHWFVHLADSMDTQDPGLPGKLNRALADLRDTLGIPCQPAAEFVDSQSADVLVEEFDGALPGQPRVVRIVGT